MRLLLDQGLPRGGAALLRGCDWDAIHVGEIGMACAQDFEILARALEESRVVVTLDGDFSMLLALSAAPGPSVIHLRRQGVTSPVAAALIQMVVHECQAELEQGAIVSLTEETVRIRRLPILRS